MTAPSGPAENGIQRNDISRLQMFARLLSFIAPRIALRRIKTDYLHY